MISYDGCLRVKWTLRFSPFSLFGTPLLPAGLSRSILLSPLPVNVILSQHAVHSQRQITPRMDFMTLSKLDAEENGRIAHHDDWPSQRRSFSRCFGFSFIGFRSLLTIFCICSKFAMYLSGNSPCLTMLKWHGRCAMVVPPFPARLLQ